jgi:hypothetical protein
MKRDAKRQGMMDDEAQVSAPEQALDPDAAPPSAARKAAAEADWLSMTTGDPALYIKDAE